MSEQRDTTKLKDSELTKEELERRIKNREKRVRQKANKNSKTNESVESDPKKPLSFEERKQERLEQRKERVNSLIDRFPDARVLSVISTAAITREFAFRANDLDGVLQGFDYKLTKAIESNDFKEAQKILKDRETLAAKLVKMEEEMQKLIASSIEDGYGSKRQLSDAGKAKKKAEDEAADKANSAASAKKDTKAA